MSKVILLPRPEVAVLCIENWRLLQTYRALHLFGLFLPRSHFWVTPAIVALDTLERLAVAEDGVTYRLTGAPGSKTLAAQFVGWCAAFDERLDGTRDVTDTHFGKASVRQRMVDTTRVEELQIAWPQM